MRPWARRLTPKTYLSGHSEHSKIFISTKALANAALIRNASFDCNEPSADTLVPINCATGPGRFSFNLRLSKTFGFGQKKESASAAGGGGMGGGTFGRGPGGPGGGHGGPV